MRRACGQSSAFLLFATLLRTSCLCSCQKSRVLQIAENILISGGRRLHCSASGKHRRQIFTLHGEGIRCSRCVSLSQTNVCPLKTQSFLSLSLIVLNKEHANNDVELLNPTDCEPFSHRHWAKVFFSHRAEVQTCSFICLWTDSHKVPPPT